MLVEYQAIIISDHAPLQLDISFPLNIKTHPPWRLDTVLLRDEEFSNKITKSIDYFLAENKSDSVSYSLLWETLKVVICGEIISFASHNKRECNKRLIDLLDAISTLDRQYALDPSPQLLKKRTGLQSEFNILSTKNAERMLLQSGGHSYEYGDKGSRLLAHQLRHKADRIELPYQRQ